MSFDFEGRQFLKEKWLEPIPSSKISSLNVSIPGELDSRKDFTGIHST